MKRARYAALAAILALTTIGGPALAAGDAALGKKVFNKCKACHSLEAGKNKIGPSLAGMFGRKAGNAEGFKKYSKAMTASGVVWDDATVAAFLASPKKMMPGTKMTFAGLKKDADIQNVIAYLKQTTQ